MFYLAGWLSPGTEGTRHRATYGRKKRKCETTGLYPTKGKMEENPKTRREENQKNGARIYQGGRNILSHHSAPCFILVHHQGERFRELVRLRLYFA